MRRAIICVCLLGVSPVLHASEAMQLLNKMSVAVHELDYQGNLVYSNGEGFSLLHIQHSFDGKSEHERISSLDGDGGTISKADGDFSMARFPQIKPNMKNVYSFDVGGVAEAAGRSCKEVVARPKDRMRYLHRYCIDTETNMLLNYSLVNSGHKTVERMMFTEIKYDKQNIKDYLKNKVSKIKKKFKPFNLIKKQKNKTNWKFSELPKGFHIESILTKGESDDGHSLEQIVLTDNVTSVSLFIEPESEHEVNENRFNSHGALNGLTLEIEEHSITAIGEVPKATLSKILNSLQYNSQ